MYKCRNLKTDSMESIGMKALGILHHLSFWDELILFDFMRGSKCFTFQLGGRQRSICRRAAFFEEIGHVWVLLFENGFYGVDWNESVGYITSRFI